MLALPNQTPGLIEQYGLTRAEVEREVWAIDPSGRQYPAVEAANRILKELNSPWPTLAALVSIPPIRWIEDRLYRWVAANRSALSRWWGAVPECERPGVECDG